MEERQHYIDRMAAKLKEWDADIRKLEAKAQVARTDVKSKYRQQVDELKIKKEDTQRKLKEIQNSTGDAWLELKDGFEKSWKALGEAVKNAIAKFK